MTRGLRTLPVYTSREYFLVAALVGAAHFLTGQLGLYILLEVHSLPAVIWPPAGIALAAVFLFGHRMWVPIALGQLAVLLTVPYEYPPLLVMTSVLGVTLQALAGGYILRRFGFEGSIANFRGVILFMGVVLCTTVVSPGISVATHLLIDTPGLSPWSYFSRGWAGGVMSALIMVPLITPWFRPLSFPFSRAELFETAVALLAVSGMSYVVFWTSLPQANIFLTLFVLFTVFFWVGLRLRPRIMALSLFVMSCLGIAGSILAQASSNSVSQQLFATELFIILVAPIFLILTSVVTERVRAVQRYSERTEELERALARLSLEDKAKAEFIATLAHELRNPLSPVMSALELLKIQKDVPEDIVPLIRSAQMQTEHMKRLLDDLLDAARLAQRSFTLKKEAVDLSTVVFQSISSVQSYLQSRNHRLSVSLPPAPILLEADPVRLEQILVNLLNNAAKYTNPGGSIALSCSIENGVLALCVADSGIGIEPDRLERIFEAFGGSEGNTRRPGGLRLGLSLAKRMAELHGGTLAVESEGTGRGSIFTLRLPLPAEPLRQPAPSSRQKSPGRARSILIVDDNEAAAVGLAKLLGHEGHQVEVVHTGRSALAAVRRIRPEIVLLDIGLPDMDGFEVAQQLRAETAGGPVPALVALTGYGQDTDKRKSQEAGFAHHLTKPVGIAELRRVIDRIKPSSLAGAV